MTADSNHNNPTPMEKIRQGVCINCDHKTKGHGHFVPPSLGDSGFYACTSVCDECKEDTC